MLAPLFACCVIFFDLKAAICCPAVTASVAVSQTGRDGELIRPIPPMLRSR